MNVLLSNKEDYGDGGQVMEIGSQWNASHYKRRKKPAMDIRGQHVISHGSLAGSLQMCIVMQDERNALCSHLSFKDPIQPSYCAFTPGLSLMMIQPLLLPLSITLDDFTTH